MFYFSLTSNCILRVYFAHMEMLRGCLKREGVRLLLRWGTLIFIISLFVNRRYFYCRILASNHFFTSFILYVKKNFVLILNGYSLNVHILIPSFIFSTISLFKSYPFI